MHGFTTSLYYMTGCTADPSSTLTGNFGQQQQSPSTDSMMSQAVQQRVQAVLHVTLKTD